MTLPPFEDDDVFDVVWDLPPADDALTLEEDPPVETRPSRDPGTDRFTLTQLLLGINVFLVVAVAAIALTVQSATWDRIGSVYIFLVTPFQTLLGIAVGYYFAERDRK